MYKQLDLAGKVAVVVGGSSGIGKVLALGLAKGGADVVSSARRKDLVDELAGEIEALGKRSLRVTCDVADRSSLERLLKACLDAFGKVDILVNAAGVTKRAPTLDYKEEDWNRILETNLTGALRACQVFGRHMIERRYGRIINIGSVTSVAGYAGLGPYGASRGGIRQLTMSLADDWGKHGITVNCLAPGWFRTEQNKVMYEDKEWVEYICDRIPMKRPGQPNDLDGAVVFLASESSRYVTGQTLLVDGGISTGATRALVQKRNS